MATVSGFSAERMLEIENASVVSGAVLLDNLMLTRRDGTTIDAGNVRGPKGDTGARGADGYQGVDGAPGPAGTITDATASGLPAGAAPTVLLGGTASARTFAFGIPKGDAGAKGDKGDTGANGANGANGTNGVDGSAAMPAGTITLWASDVAPTNWLICDGSAVSRTTYASLFSAIGTKYGAGDGVNTFNLPNLKGQTPVGKDSAQTEFAALNQKGGEKAHLLTAAESGLPSHSHVYDPQYYLADGTPRQDGSALTGGSKSTLYPNAAQYASMPAQNTNASGPTNASQAHNVLQPYTVVNFIIKITNGDTPNDSQLTQRVSTLETFTGASPAGTITIWGGDNAPTNWLICDGAAISRTTYASLFAAIGTKYGAGDGSSTFNLPNFKGRTPTGLDTTQTEFNALGKTGGTKTHNHLHISPVGLTSGNMYLLDPSAAAMDQQGHYDFYSIQNAIPSAAIGGKTTATLETHIVTSSDSGTLQPYLTVNYIIKFTNGDTQGDSQLTQRVSAIEAGTNTGAVLDRERNRLQRVLSGGGVRKVTSGGISWTQPFVTPSAARDANVPSGTFVLDMPANGTVIPVYYAAGGITSATVANGSVPLTGSQALYFEIPFGKTWNAQTFSATNYRILDYTTDQAFTVPSNWILVCVRVNDGISPAYTWGDGRAQDFWHAVSFQNGWGNFNSGFQQAGYKMASDGDVKLRGLVGAGTAATIFTLPVAYAPELSAIFNQTSNVGGARVDVTNSATVLVNNYYSGGSSQWVSLEGIRWSPA